VIGVRDLQLQLGGRAVLQEAWEAVVLLLDPITPHICHVLRQGLGHAETLLEDLPYPKPDPAALVKDTLRLAVQVNGKLRGEIDVPIGAERAAVEALALADAGVQRFLAGATPKKVIVVPGKIVNIVL